MIPACVELFAFDAAFFGFFGFERVQRSSAQGGEVGLGQPAPRIPSEIPFTPRAKRASSFAAKEVGALNQTQIGAEHIFLGLLLEGHGVAALVLKSLGVDSEKVRAEIRRELA
jgi:ATP-dependent Clp protease ATP-binding subunit ClpC